MRARLPALLAAALLLVACGSGETRRITYALAAAQERLGGTPVKLLATAHPTQQDLVIFYQFKKDNPESCGSGVALVRPGQPDQALDEEHPCAATDTPISTTTKSGVLGEYTITYGLVFEARVARVAVDFGGAGSVDASRSGGAWWVLRRGQQAQVPVQVVAYDQAGKVLQTVRPVAAQ